MTRKQSKRQFVVKLNWKDGVRCCSKISPRFGGILFTVIKALQRLMPLFCFDFASIGSAGRFYQLITSYQCCPAIFLPFGIAQVVSLAMQCFKGNLLNGVIFTSSRRIGVAARNDWAVTLWRLAFRKSIQLRAVVWSASQLRLCHIPINTLTNHRMIPSQFHFFAGKGSSRSSKNRHTFL